MSQASSSFGSNNPFRRKTPGVPTPQSTIDPTISARAFSPDGLAIVSTDSAATPGLSSNSDQFRKQLQDLAQPAQPPPLTTFQKPKVVKRVRVQSPPPSSPESAVPPDHYPSAGRDEVDGDDDGESSSSDDKINDDDDDELRDPFGNIPVRNLPGTGGHIARPVQAPIVVQRAPPNPFQKTLKDLEGGTGDETDEPRTAPGAPGGRGTMDVDAFRRLLMTGQTGEPSPLPVDTTTKGIESPSAQLGSHPSIPSGDGASTADTSSVSRQSLFDTAAPVQDTPRTSHEVSEAEPEKVPALPATGRRPKPPPPPSSRHGKLINVELKNRGNSVPEDSTRPSSSAGRGKENTASFPSPPQQRPLTPSNVNKPLPPAPMGFHQGEDAESIFDREAAGKVPEMDTDTYDAPLSVPRPPTPPKASHMTSSPAPGAPQLPAKPPPPPRRQTHGRSDSKLSIAGVTPPAPFHPEEFEPSPRRSSQESIRSRSSSLRANVNAPAPPPPRRSVHAPPRTLNSFISPSSVSFSSVTSTISERSPSDVAELSPLPTQHLTPSDPTPGDNPASPPGSSTSLPTENPSPFPTHHPNHNHPKLAPPPPPPARNASVRSKRPPSVSSLDATSRRVHTPSHSSMGPPPPPPPSRQRGGSKGSIDGAAGLPRRTSADSVRFLPGVLAEEPGPTTDDSAVAVASSGQANDILADLTALQREVDALRGRFEKERGG